MMMMERLLRGAWWGDHFPRKHRHVTLLLLLLGPSLQTWMEEKAADKLVALGFDVLCRCVCMCIYIVSPDKFKFPSGYVIIISHPTQGPRPPRSFIQNEAEKMASSSFNDFLQSWHNLNNPPVLISTTVQAVVIKSFPLLFSSVLRRNWPDATS